MIDDDAGSAPCEMRQATTMRPSHHSSQRPSMTVGPSDSNGAHDVAIEHAVALRRPCSYSVVFGSANSKKVAFRQHGLSNTCLLLYKVVVRAHASLPPAPARPDRARLLIVSMRVRALGRFALCSAALATVLAIFDHLIVRCAESSARISRFPVALCAVTAATEPKFLFIH